MTGLDPTTMSGLELLRTAFDNAGPPSGIGKLLGMAVRAVDEGTVSFAVTTSPDFANPLGSVHGGICATLLDSAMGCAVHTTLPAGVGYSTLEIKVNYIRSVPIDAGELVAIGTVIHRGRTTATAEGKVVDSAGRLIAHGSTTCIILG
ncbi:PaaI family thioesterase [Antrihabitans cavernicola]|uniref:PaaI family thioesterase n=1 Tax=Antrihabitans cavernicola TaxID=2495913 RepID=A0A5A7SHA9_9NOCA|nr:PaaI family thioesterase [Spelaeibacter cavernicola]KAA0024789.1 PaaI family thioesterase [Spelaeibacter cavernicola]